MLPRPSKIASIKLFFTFEKMLIFHKTKRQLLTQNFFII